MAPATCCDAESTWHDAAPSGSPIWWTEWTATSTDANPSVKARTRTPVFLPRLAPRRTAPSTARRKSPTRRGDGGLIVETDLIDRRPRARSGGSAAKSPRDDRRRDCGAHGRAGAVASAVTVGRLITLAVASGPVRLVRVGVSSSPGHITDDSHLGHCVRALSPHLRLGAQRAVRKKGSGHRFRRAAEPGVPLARILTRGFAPLHARPVRPRLLSVRSSVPHHPPSGFSERPCPSSERMPWPSRLRGAGLSLPSPP
jgi:hypothetical protein